MVASRTTDTTTLRDALAWHQRGVSVLLATVARTYGSSPRPVGSLAAFAATGAVSGSVSGGCVEDDIAARFAAGSLQRTEVLQYGGADAARFGLPCGGTLDVVVEPHPDPATLAALLERLERRELISREVDLVSGYVHLDVGTPGAAPLYDGRRLICTYGPAWRLLVIGANAITLALCPIALSLGYAVEVCDPRTEYGQHWDLADVPLHRSMPDDFIRVFVPDVRTAVITLAHDPKIDDLALLEALESDAFYVGALGSLANNARRRQRLAALGISSQALERMHGPVGLAIGSRTPAEIAVAIAAQLIQERSRQTEISSPVRYLSGAALKAFV
ncbi:MAG TPA: XdhC family protein [Acidiferrobacteraceae bacterium]|nr:XdhC family protein [Acidiferrobacteraceae bacterium]